MVNQSETVGEKGIEQDSKGCRGGWMGWGAKGKKPRTHRERAHEPLNRKTLRHLRLRTCEKPGKTQKKMRTKEVIIYVSYRDPHFERREKEI